MIIPRAFIAVAIGLLACFASANASPLPQPSSRAVVLTGADLVAGLKTDTRKDADALGGSCAIPREKYQTLVRTAPPAEGETLHIWIRYRDLALQMKTRVGGKTVESPWNWQRNAGGFGWRLVGSYKRRELGDTLWFINDPKFSASSGIDALVITADTAWKPPGATSAAKAPAPAAENPDAPDAANATVTLASDAPVESDAPGTAEVRIDWTKTGARIPPALYSLNNFRGHSASHMSDPKWHAGIAYMAPRLLRLHNAGLVRSWFDAAAGAWDYEKIRSALEAGRPPEGTALMININSWPSSYDADEDGRLDPDRLGDFSRLCADLVRFVNLEIKAGVLYWEITNEKDFAYWRKPRKNNQPDIAALARIHNTVAAAMRAADPSIKIGGPAACNPLPIEPLLEFARLTLDKLDFLSFHNYASGSSDEPDQVIYEKTNAMARDTAEVVRRLRRLAPEKAIEVHLNEFNICYSWRVPEPRMANHKGAVFDALSLIAYAGIPGLTATNAWNDQDRVYGKMDNAGELRPGAHVYHYFNTLLLGVPAAASTSADQAVVPFAVVDGKAGRPAFVLVNRTNGVRTVTLSETPAQAGAWQVASLSAGGLQPVAASSPFTAPVTLAPHSVNFYWLN